MLHRMQHGMQHGSGSLKADDEVADTLNGYKEIANFVRCTVRQAKHRVAIGAIPVFKQGRIVCARKSRILASFDRAERERSKA